MKTFTCGEVVPGCSASFSSDSFEDLLQQISDHAANDHGVSPLPAEVIEKVTAFWQRPDAGS